MTTKKNEDFVSENEVNMESVTNEQIEDGLLDESYDNMSDNDVDEDLQEKYKELNDSYLRLHAEFDNYRKRTIKEKADLLKTGGERIFVDLLPVVDDFERALENIDKAEDLDAVKEGVTLIYNKFISFLSKNGVKEIDAVGEPFDVDKHEAITTIPATSDDQKDKIIDCVQKGYVLGDKVIRYPKVIVAK